MLLPNVAKQALLRIVDSRNVHLTKKTKKKRYWILDFQPISANLVKMSTGNTNRDEIKKGKKNIKRL